MGFRKFFESKEIKELRAKMESSTGEPEAHFNLAAAYERAGRLEEAVHEFEETLKLNPKSAETNYNLAILFETKNEGDKAILHILKAGNLFSNKNDQVNKVESRRLLREYYKKFDAKPEDFSQIESDLFDKP